MKIKDLKKRLDKNRPMRVASSQVEIIVVSSIERFRRLAKELPTCRDAVLEIGCSTGVTTRILARRCARVVAVDVARGLVEELQSELAGFGNVTVARVDGRDAPGLLALLPEPDLIFLDIGGTALLGNVASVLRQCLRTFAPRLIVVRSFELATLSSVIADVEPPDASSLRRIDTHDRLAHALNSLLDLSRSSNASDRAFAARKLRALGTPAALERLREMADDPQQKVRRIARLGREAHQGDGSEDDRRSPS